MEREQLDIRETYSLKNVAYTTIRNKILNCDIMPGDRIREDLLAEEMNISRTPVREAMNRLVMDGLIINVPRKGLYCVEITAQTIDDVCDVRKMVDLYAMRRCCGKLDQKQVDYLMSIVTKMENSGVDEEQHIAFHAFFIKQAGNALMLRVENMYDTYLKMMFALSNYGQVQMRAVSNISEHRMMVECARDNRLDELEKICEHHVDRLRTDLYAYLKQRHILK